MVGEHEDQRIRDQQGDAIAKLVGGREGAKLVSVFCFLDAPGIDRDVLCRRSEGDDQREGADCREASRSVWADRGHCQQGDRDDDLDEDRPAAALAELAEDGQAHLVDHRRPEDLERVGKADP